jgi:hypothetical protein
VKEESVVSTNPYAGSQRAAPKDEFNGWGVAGFVTAILGIFTCGFLHPLSLLISLVGLMWKPRGLAIAGVIISVLGSGFLMISGYALVLGFLGMKEFVTEEGKRFNTNTTLSEAAQVIERHQASTGELPDPIEGNKLLMEMQDAWGQSLRYETSDRKFVIRSAGPDRQMNTADDLVSTDKQVETEVVIEGGGELGEGPFIIPEDGSAVPPDPFSENLELPESPEVEKLP